MSFPHMLEQNGVFQRKHRHIVDMGLTFIGSSRHASLLGGSF